MHLSDIANLKKAVVTSVGLRSKHERGAIRIINICIPM
jgi:hypothetical protein